MTHLYNYKIKVQHNNVYDGDTILKCRVDLGFDVWVIKSLRLAGINTPEIRTTSAQQKELGYKARDVLRDMICYFDDITIDVHGQGKYGRWLVTIFKGKLNMCQWMIDNGHAIEYLPIKKSYY